MIYGIFKLDDWEELIQIEAYYLWINGSDDHLKNWFDAKEIVLNKILTVIHYDRIVPN